MHNVSADKQKLQIIQQCMGLLRSIVDSNDQGLSAVIKELEKQAQDIFKSNPEFAEKLRNIIKSICVPSLSMSEYLAKLEQCNVMVKVFMHDERSIRGLRYEYHGIAYSSKQLGREFSWQRLPQLGILYEPERDLPALLNRVLQSPSSLSSNISAV